jgi:hypothetical protein
MSTTIDNAAVLNNAIYGKPQFAAPGATTQIVTTVTETVPVAPPAHKGFEIFSSVFGVAASVLMFCGAALNLTAMALVLTNPISYDTTIGGLLVAGFSLWFLSAILLWIPNFGGFTLGTRAGYHIFGVFANLLQLSAFALFIAGAGCSLSFGYLENIRLAGLILWIIASGLWLGGALLRDLGLRYDAMITYRDTPVLPVDGTKDQRLPLHLSSIWSNAFATDLLLLSATLFLLGSIMFLVEFNNRVIAPSTSRSFNIAGGVLWIVGSSIMLFTAIFQAFARR